MSLKLLIFQFRSGEVAESEQRSFIEKLGISRDELIFINTVEDNYVYPDVTSLKGIILGGSGDNSLTADHAWFDPLAQYISSAIDLRIPILGICFGHQLLGRIYGAEVVSDVKQKEIGTVPITIRDEHMHDPLLSGLESTFFAIAGHNDSVINPPSTLDVLAYNECCSIQIFKVKDKNVYGVQFHPELNQADYNKRLMYYKDYFFSHGQDIEELIRQSSSPTNDDALLRNFCNNIVPGQDRLMS